MIPGVCPDCGAERPLPDFLADAQSRTALAAALDCPAPLARLIAPYIALHAPAKRRVTMPKLARLLRELADLLASDTLTRGKDILAITPAIWAEALTDVLVARDAGRLTLPLTGHGYLSEIAFRKARAAGEQSLRERTPAHHSHLPAAPPGSPAASDPRAERQELLSDRRALEMLATQATPEAAANFRQRIASIDERLRAIGIELAPPTDR